MYLTTLAIIGSIIFILIKGGSDILQKITSATSTAGSMKGISMWMIVVLIINILLLFIILIYYFNRLKNKPVGRPGLKGLSGPKGDKGYQSDLSSE